MSDAARAPSTLSSGRASTFTYDAMLRSLLAWSADGWRSMAHARASGCVVALQLHRSLEQVVGIVGVLHSGGAYLPLDPQWPSERQCFMIGRCCACICASLRKVWPHLQLCCALPAA